MKKKLLFAILLLTITANAQKNNSLFWEISGNGLQKNSYIYGTMHVNDKVSYHLSDAFFKHLLAADIVANESDPETWGDVVELLSNNQFENRPNFYSEFYLFPADREQTATAFVNDNYFNSMLSGIEDGEQADFQENTVLDMFIFQTGKKYKKKTLGLEDATQSMLSLLQLKEEDVKPTEENKAILVKMLKNKSFSELLRQYYREKDIVLLDSVYKLMFSKKAHAILITTRNEIMVKSLDSLVRKGSVFSGLGAAHLAGKKGIIELLKQKGYTLTPITDHFTNGGQNKKKSIEAFFPNPEFTLTADDDGMVTMPLNKKRILKNDDMGSPDFTNGGSISIKRLPLNDFLRKDGNTYDLKALDSLFFENIAGNISEKKYFETQNYRGFDIKNTTKTGNSQRHRFYITPLELITISMIGSGNYVREYETAVFDQIAIKPFSNSWQTVSPAKGGFSIDVPTFNAVYGNNPEKVSNIQLQAYDHTEKSYYFLIEKTLNATNYLEDSAFEHRQIHHEFYVQHGADTLKTAFGKDHTFTSESLIGDKKIKLQTLIKGSKYYLLGTVNASENNTNRFFNSFKMEPFHYQSEVKTFRDSLANFSVAIPEKQNVRLFLNLDQDEISDKNIFNAHSKQYTFNSESGKTVHMEYYRYHKYETMASIDSVRLSFRDAFTKYSNEKYTRNNSDYTDNYEFSGVTSLLNSAFHSRKGFSVSKWNALTYDQEAEKYKLLSETATFDKEKRIHTIDAVVSKADSDQLIKYKVLFREDSYCMLDVLMDKSDKNDDPFIEQTLHSLEFTQPSKSSVFEDKIALFINDAKSDRDTIRYSALKSVYNLKLAPKDFAAISDFLNTFDFQADETDAAAALLEQIGGLTDARVIPFLDKYYQRKNANAHIQLSVLEALCRQKSKAGYKKILELMEYDLPLSDNAYDIEGLFHSFERDAGNSKILYPDIFQFYGTQEYKSPLIRFCNHLLESGLVNVKSIHSFKKQIVSNANSEFKRISSRPRITDVTTAEYVENETANYDLISYINLLYYFPKDRAIQTLFDKISALDLREVQAEFLRLGSVNGKVTDAEIAKALQNSETRFIMMQLLLNSSRKNPLVSFTDDDIATAAVINFESLSADDSAELLEKRVVTNKGHSFTYFFYSIQKQKGNATEPSEKQLYAVAFINENGRINPLAYKAFGPEIDIEEEREEQYNVIINSAINWNHPRASFRKYDAYMDETRIY